MSYVKVNFPLPVASVPLPGGPGLCRFDVKRGTQTIRPTPLRTKVIVNPKAPRTKMIVNPKAQQSLSGFWSTLLNGSVSLFKATTGVPLPIPAAGGSKATQPAQAAAAPQQQLGPLARVSTSTVVVGVLAFSGLLLAIARR